MTRTEKFIKDKSRVLQGGSEYVNLDTGLMKKEQYSQAKLRVLVVFTAWASNKALSLTMSVMNDYVIANCPDVFIDFCYLPTPHDIKECDDAYVPYAIGCITHLDPSHFDVVGFSVSTLPELIVPAYIIGSFDRCDTKIPVSWTERKDLKIGSGIPLICIGGMSSSYSDILFGDLSDGRKSFLDFCHLGECHCLSEFYNHLIGCKDNKISIQDSINSYWNDFPYNSYWLYQPQAYDVKFDGSKVISNEKINQFAPDFCKPYYPKKMSNDLGSARSIIAGNGGNSGITQVIAAQGCSSCGACSFCMEAWYSGGWVEQDKERILELADVAKKTSASDSFKMFSYNTNYLSDYKGLLYECSKIFPKVAYSNMRLEELGKDTDTMNIMAATGSRRLAAPIEGISERIRNNILNKNLSNDSIDSFLNHSLTADVLDVKVGVILTGYEEDQDWQEMYNFCSKWKARIREAGSNTPIRYKATLLVQYPNTPIQYLERRAARMSYLGSAGCPKEWNDKFYDDEHIRIDLNGYKHSTFIEQAVIDMGRHLTPWLYKHVYKAKAPVYNFRPVLHKECWSDLCGMIYLDHFFDERDPDTHISITHRVRLPLHDIIVAHGKELVSKKHDASSFKRCLKVHESDKPVCLSSSVGCKGCSNAEERSRNVNREIISTRSYKDFQMLKRKAPSQRLRFKIKRLPDYSALSPRNTLRTFMSQLLQLSPNLASMFYEVVDVHPFHWQSEDGAFYAFDGVQAVDVLFTDPGAIRLVRELLQEVNDKLITVKIVDVREASLQDTFYQTDLNLFKFESTLPKEAWDLAAANYTGEVRVVDRGRPSILHDKSLKTPSYITRSVVDGYFLVPTKYSPWGYLQGFFSGRNVSFRSVIHSTRLTCVSTFRKSDVSCVCGYEGSIVDLVDGKTYPVGEKCLLSLLTKELYK